MRIDLPQNVNFIIDTLYEHGFEAYAVGGCVRDSLLGRTDRKSTRLNSSHSH